MLGNNNKEFEFKDYLKISDSYDMKLNLIQSIFIIIIFSSCLSTHKNVVTSINNKNNVKENNVISCTPGDGTTISCVSELVHAVVAEKTQICNSTGTDYMYGPCFISSCENGYFVQDGFCLLRNGSDPLFLYSWYLENRAQSVFSVYGGSVGADLNLPEKTLNGSGVLGRGVRIAISDTGIQTKHEDLASNINHEGERNYTYSISSYWERDPTPSISQISMTDGYAHGTAVAGIIGSKGWNDLGSRGVAPEARLTGLLYILTSVSDAKTVDQLTGPFDIFNYSYGINSCRFYPIESSVLDRIKAGVNILRGGLGAIYVKVSGNERVGTLDECGYNSDDLYFGNANLEGENSHPYYIIVGALDANDSSTTYSTPGSNLWISGYGGSRFSTQPGMITTDYSGCEYGFSSMEPEINVFEQDNHPLNIECKYTSVMRGTSAAVPTVSGVIALLLETNPNLSWRDVKHILASTATRIDTNSTDSNHPGTGEYDGDMVGHIYQQGWAQNSAGYFFHNQYGFGKVNTEAALLMADPAKYITLSSWFEYTGDSGTISLVIPEETSLGVESIINIPINYVIESVQVTLSMDHLHLADVGVELYSPSGTKSILMNINSNIVDENMNDYKLLSNAFYGENSLGTWRLKVLDGHEDLGERNLLTRWKVTIFGHIKN